MGTGALTEQRKRVHYALKFFKRTADKIQAPGPLPTELKPDLILILLAFVVFQLDCSFASVVGKGEEVRHAGHHAKPLQLHMILDRGLSFVGDVEH